MVTGTSNMMDFALLLLAHVLAAQSETASVLNQQCVAAQSEYRGKTYYFCVDNCRKKFAQDPERYLVAPQTNLAR